MLKSFDPGIAGRVAAGIARGFAMGAADLVPGVSGATVALLLGIYERLLASARAAFASLGRIARRDVQAARQYLLDIDWLLVIPVACGLCAAVALLASLIEAQLTDHPTEMAGLFCGLVAASVVTACRMFKWRHADRLLLTSAVAITTFALLGLQANTVVADPPLLAFFGAGAVSICATVLPGISGSFLLLLLGMYPSVLHAVNERLFGDIAVLAAGAVVGVALISTLLSRLLEHHKDSVMAILVGLMTGSVRVLWPWPDGVGTIDGHAREPAASAVLSWPGADDWAAPTLFATVGFTAVMLLTCIQDRMNTPRRRLAHKPQH